MKALPRRPILGAATLAALGGLAFACRTTDVRSGGALAGDAASRVYVEPGKHDEFYAFLSGGYNGQIGIYGLPSGRLLKFASVFSQNPETGYGYNEETKPMLQTTYGFIPWDDLHHPELSQTNGVPDGRWLFANGVNTPRVARFDLSTMETTEILEIPNTAGQHASAFTTPDTKYIVAATRFSIPIGPNADVAIDSASYRQNFKGTLTFISANEPGKMDIAFQILMPGYNFDLGHAGKGPSDGWFFFSTYNTEQAYTKLELNASQNDKDFVAAVNYRLAEQCVAQGKARSAPGNYFHNHIDEKTHQARSERRTSTRMLAPVIPVHSFSKLQQAISGKQFDGEVQGIPVLKYNATLAGEVQKPGLGPLHTEFDGKGNAYTSMFISSEIVKWKLGTWEVLDRIPVYYSVGHLMIPGGDSKQPWGKYLVAMNKITKDRYLPTGPELSQSAQLIDISGDKMKMLLDFPTIGEPHYAQALPAALIKDKQVKFYRLADNTHPGVVKAETEGGITRNGKTVSIKMAAIRSHFAPDNLEGVQVGDTVLFHVTNIEQDWDIVHGFAVLGAENSELIISPGATRTLKWTPKAPGVYPFYCTDFCSALHQEMSGYIRVSPAGSNVPLMANTSAKAAAQMAKLNDVKQVPGPSPKSGGGR
jgi:nitrous-oxide reductase